MIKTEQAQNQEEYSDLKISAFYRISTAFDSLLSCLYGEDALNDERTEGIGYAVWIVGKHLSGSVSNTQKGSHVKQKYEDNLEVVTNEIRCMYYSSIALDSLLACLFGEDALHDERTQGLIYAMWFVVQELKYQALISKEQRLNKRRDSD